MPSTKQESLNRLKGEAAVKQRKKPYYKTGRGRDKKGPPSRFVVVISVSAEIPGKLKARAEQRPA